MEGGVVFTQSGVPIRGSADYQKVLDSRWRFIEVEVEQEVVLNLPTTSPIAFADRYHEYTPLVRHNLGFLPLFESNLEQFDSDPLDGIDIVSDSSYVYARRLISNFSNTAQNIVGRVRVYNLPILEEYVAPKEFVVGSQSPESTIGMQFLEEGGGTRLGEVSPIGYSIDTKKKILSIHKHGFQHINPWVGNVANVTAIDTATDILTISFNFGDFTQFSIVGTAISYSPFDFVTYPAPLVAGGTYFVIPIDSTHCRLASSYQNAVDGIALNLTSTGSLPGQMQTVEAPGNPQNRIFHDVGYPPTFLLAELAGSDNVPNARTDLIRPMLYSPPTHMTADARYINFFGVQAVFTGKYGYVILKDPVELAR